MSFLKFGISEYTFTIKLAFWLIKVALPENGVGVRSVRFVHLSLQASVDFGGVTVPGTCVVYHPFEEFPVCGVFAELLNEHFE